MTVSGPFSHMSIARKILLGYLAFSLLIVVVAVLSITSIEKLNRVNRSILTNDLPLIEVTGRMIDSILAQETLGRRFAILRDAEMRELFEKRSREYEGYLGEMRALLESGGAPAERVVGLSSEYGALFREWFSRAAEPPAQASQEFDGLVKAKQAELIAALTDLSTRARLSQDGKIRLTAEIGTSASHTMMVVCIFSVLSSLAAALFITRTIEVSVSRLKRATRQIAQGNFDDVPRVQSRDELGDLSAAVVEMARRLKKLEEIYLDTSPLTRLPGGVAIEKVLMKRLEARVPFAFCLLDLDNFKAFADKYGYARGSEVIKVVARVIEDAVAEHGTGGDFVGHIGGDDFVIVTEPERYQAICTAVVEDFDRIIPEFYDAEDRQRGHIMGKTRQGQEASFPVMTISIGVVTPHARDLRDPIQIGEAAAELKEYAKSQPRSLYVADDGGR